MSNSSSNRDSLPRLLGGPCFEVLRRPSDNNLYIDKTHHLPQLLATKSPLFVRPRRFGKSTMLSAIYSLLTGDRKIFMGLDVDKSWDWSQTYPVLRFEFSTINRVTLSQGREGISAGLSFSLKQAAEFQHEIKIDTPNSFFSGTIRAVLEAIYKKSQKETGSKKGVVILLDEYDYLLQPYILNPTKKGLGTIEEVLQEFFETIKSLTSTNVVHSLISTGICKVSGINLYSSLNFVTDVSSRPEFATMFGYTRQEILHYFEPFMDSAIKKNKLLSIDDLMEKLTELYNGYAFSPEDVDCKVFNPFSILNFFLTENFEAFWFSNSIDTLTSPPYCQHIEPLLKGTYIPQVDEYTLRPQEVDKYTVEKMLFFTGYLTLKHSLVDEKKCLILDWPNKEVNSRFALWYAQIQTHIDMDALEGFSNAMRRALLKLDIDTFCLYLQVLVRSSLQAAYHEKETPYEAHFHLMTDVALKMSGMEFTLSEVSQVAGRIDLISYIGDYCYIFELKVVDKETAIEKKIKEIKKQVDSKQYSHGVPAITASRSPYQQCVVGLVFSKSRNLVAYTIVSSPNKEVLPEKDVLDIVERATTLKVSCEKHITIQRQKEEEPSTGVNQADRWSNELRATQDLYEKMIRTIEEKNSALITAHEGRLKAEAEAARLKDEAEAARIKGEADAEAARLKGEADAEAARLKGEADAEAARLKGEADAEAARLKGEAEAARLKDEGSSRKMKAIRKLEKEGYTSKKICNILSITPEEWFNLTDEKFSE